MRSLFTSKLRRLVLIPLMSISLGVSAQDRTISGKVTVSDDGSPLPGVNVVLKGTTNGVVTDVDGAYSLSVPSSGGILIFSFIGMTTTEEEIGERAEINVALVSDAKALEEVVIVGYGEQKKLTVTGAVTAVSGSDLIKSPAVSVSNSLAGRLPGVVAIQSNGEPGYDQSQILIRGINTTGNSSPLIVIDGIPDRDGGLNRLNPNDIETMSVLKDASAAIYGSRAANGVILITTKRGKSGKPKVSYSFNQGWSRPTVIPEMSNAPEYAEIMNEIGIYKNIPSSEWTAAWNGIKTVGTFTSPTTNQTVNAQYSPTDVQKYKDGSDPWGHPNTDWFGDAIKNWSPQTQHNLSISGGGENVSYMASLGYVNQDAIYNNSATYYKQYNLRINLDTKISQYIKNSLGVMIREENRNFPTQSAGSIFRMLMRGRPTEPEVWPNGLPGPDIENGQNPYVITTNQTGYVKNPTDYLQTNGNFEITNPWVEGLKLTLSGSFDRNINRNKVWETPWYLYTWDKISYEPDGVTPKLNKVLRSTFTDPRLTQSESTVSNTNLTGLLNYDRTLGNHSIGVLLGATKETFKGDNFFAYRRNFISPAIDQLFAGGSDLQNTGGGAYNRARLGYYGRITYNFQEKYLIEVVGRRDGSYNFPSSGRFGFFPGILVGWNISNEDFFQNNVKPINFLKIRGSYGQMGNDQVYYQGSLQEYAYLSAYGLGTYPINSQVVNTVGESIVPNYNFTWEVANNTNVGLEGKALAGRLDFDFEYFYNKRTKMLIANTGGTPGSAGIPQLPPVNAGIMENKGFEFKLGYNGNAGDLAFTVGANGGYAKNKVIFASEVKGNPEYQWQEGKPLGAVIVYKSAGAFKDQADIDQTTAGVDYSGITGTLLPGDLKIVDYNNDGVIDGKDAVRLEKNATPTFNFGANINLTYKNFDLTILFQGATGAVIRYQTESGDIGNFLKYSHDHRWSIDNPSSTDPRLASRGDTYYTGGNFGNNTYFLLNKNYVRLKNIELGYNVPNKLVSKLAMSNLRIYVNSLNLFTWASQKLFDPEATSGSGQYYPQSKVINTGILVTF